MEAPDYCTQDTIHHDYSDVKNNELKKEIELLKKYLVHIISGKEISYEINEWYIKHTIRIKEEKEKMRAAIYYQKKKFEKSISELENELRKLDDFPC